MEGDLSKLGFIFLEDWRMFCFCWCWCVDCVVRFIRRGAYKYSVILNFYCQGRYCHVRYCNSSQMKNLICMRDKILVKNNCQGSGYKILTFCFNPPPLSSGDPCNGHLTCNNGGWCLQRFNGGYACKCSGTGYYGDHCEKCKSTSIRDKDKMSTFKTLLN